jgi:hypothetical protein
VHVENPLQALYKNYLLFTIHFKVRIIELFWLVNFGNIIQSERSLHILSEMIWFIDRPILLAPYFLIVRFIRTVTAKTRNQSWRKSSERQNNGRSDELMNHVCPNVRHENITLWSSSWQLKFIHSQFPLPMALNSVFSVIKMSDRDLNFFLFIVRPTRSYL